MHQECMVGNELLGENSATEILQHFLLQPAPLTSAAHLWVLNGLGQGCRIQVLFQWKMRWTPLTHLTKELFSFSLGFFCDCVCPAKHFLFASSPDLMQPSLTVITRANNAEMSHLPMFFPRKGDGKVEVSTRSPRGKGHSIVPLPFPLTGKDIQVAWVKVFHSWWEVQGKNGFICSTF